MDYNKEKKKLLSAKTPEKYIELSHQSAIEGRSKSIITREWMDKTGYTIEDINSARNRHPYWKKLKARGSYERTVKRLKEHDYRDSTTKLRWNREMISHFYDLNKKGMADFELAKEFSTTLPSVNHIRRKLMYSRRILEAEGGKTTKAKILDLSLHAEKALIQRLKEVEKPVGKKRRKKS